MTQNDRDGHDTGRFTIHADSNGPAPEPPPAVDVHMLRLDRLNSRVTLLALMVPCFMVAILAVVYLDVKKRVDSTQSSGSVGIQRLSDDLAAMAGRQIALETRMTAQSKEVEATTASIQARLKTTVDEIQRMVVKKSDQAALDTAASQMESQLADLRKEMSALNAVITTFDEEISAQIQEIADGIKKNQELFAALEKKTQSLGAGLVDKDALDLAIRLERLSVQEMVKEQMEAINKKLSALENANATLKKQMESMKKTSDATPAATYSPPKPVMIPSSGKTGAITEQPLN